MEDEASVKDVTPAPKKSAPKKSVSKKRAKKEKNSVKLVVETKTVEPVEETKSVEPVEAELQEEPISDGEDESQKKSIPKKNGSLLKLGPDKFQVFWDDKTYVIDMEDNSVWTHDAEYDIITCVGEWNPETKEVEMDVE